MGICKMNYYPHSAFESLNNKTHQVDGYAPSDEKATVDIHGMALELNDASQATDNATDDEGKHQEWLQELRRVSQSGIKVHLWKETSLLTEV